MSQVRVQARGPIVVLGDVEVVDADGEILRAPGPGRLKLCRCGHSRTSPLCDGSHNRVGFDPAPERETEHTGGGNDG